MSFLFPYYGSKYRLAKHYPPPAQSMIIEPFAGGAGYASTWYDKDVILFDIDPLIVGLWEYLIRTTPAEILRLPLLEPGQTTDTLHVCQEAKWLIGFWCNPGTTYPRKQLSKWAKNAPASVSFWSRACRERVAYRIALVKHWRVFQLPYRDIPYIDATWYVDPPYQASAGDQYRCRDVDFPALADWCLGLRSQVIVCEQEGAVWLPFRRLKEIHGIKKRSVEVICEWQFVNGVFQ